jgi:hypothetical protein
MAADFLFLILPRTSPVGFDYLNFFEVFNIHANFRVPDGVAYLCWVAVQ